MSTGDCTLRYEDTHRFSSLILDYLSNKKNIAPFYAFRPTKEGIEQALHQRQQFPTDRGLLINYFRRQYKDQPLTEQQELQLQKLASPETFTVTTAHQPNLFTGPLYFLYKIVHTIRLANELEQELPGKHIVPIFYMGSEDADFDELGHFYLGSDKQVWQTNQSGAFGRMRVEGLEALIQQIDQQYYDLPFVEEFTGLLRSCFRKGRTIQEATFDLTNRLFGRFGLLVVVPDDAELKRAFQGIVQRELLEGFSQPLVEATSAALSTLGYKPQAGGRPINLFYLNDAGQRERIERAGSTWMVEALGLTWGKAELMTELETHPERFSANVILRGLFQETILPNLVFIGGGGEVAYWMQLKGLFEASGIPFPVLMLRNSFQLVSTKEAALQAKLGLDASELYLTDLAVQDLLVSRQVNITTFDSATATAALANLYGNVMKQVAPLNEGLLMHAAALHTIAIKGIEGLEKKARRAARKKLGIQLEQWQTLRRAYFPNGNLQERVHHMAPYYATYGTAFIDWLYQHSSAYNDGFKVLQLPDAGTPS